MSYPGEELCPRCHGDGQIAVNPGYPDPQTETDALCPECGGTGTVRELDGQVAS